jgi:adenylate cyclase
MDLNGGDSVYRFEGFTIDAARGLLLDYSGEEVPLRHKSFELLRLFIENVDVVLDRDRISQAIWPDVIVDDNGIAQCVRDIRRALNDEAQTIIRTVPRRGYVFNAPATSRTRSLSTAEVAPLSDRPSIAVLAFTNMSGDPDQEYFSDGIADDIITDLSHIRWLLVIARNSSFSYKGKAIDVKHVGRELGVRYVLEGGVRRSGERVRVTAQLVEADTGNHIWAERFDRALADVFAVQNEIADAVATAIGPAVAGAEMQRAMRHSPRSLGAWELYQQGLWHLTKLDATENDAARLLFERAIGRDPRFVAAYVGLSLACFRAGALYQTAPVDEANRLASMNARKAVELDPGDASAQAELARTLLAQGDADDALAIARQALSLNPNCADAHWVMGIILIFTGRPAEGRQAVDVFLRLSPCDAGFATTLNQIAISYYFERDYERCVEAARRQLSAHPDSPWANRWLAAGLGQLGRTAQGRVVLERFIAGSPREFDLYVRNRVPWMRAQDHEHMLDGLRKAGWGG